MFNSQGSNISSQITTMLNKRKNFLTGEGVDITIPQVKSKIKDIESKGNSAWNKLNKVSGRTYLWSNLKDFKNNSASITLMYDRVFNMALAYSTNLSIYHNNNQLKTDIIDSLEWLHNNVYNKNLQSYGNWWDWQIGSSKNLTNIVILMNDALTLQQKINYMSTIENFVSSAIIKTKTGANLTDECIVKLLQGIILQDISKIKEGAEGILPVFNYVTTGDGFYTDGSFIQHNNVAYTGSYGAVLLEGIADILYIIEGTNWSIQSPSKNNTYDWILNSFDPIIYKGQVMEIVRGRSLSRALSTGFKQGSNIIENMVKLSYSTNTKYSNKIKSLIKKYESANSNIDFASNFKWISIIELYYNIINDTNITPAKELSNNYCFNCMDKTVHRRTNYALAISRSSARVKKYECMSGQNLKPWFQGDGVTYLYNSDTEQFTNDFWPTIDPYRLPGTTVNKSTRTNAKWSELGLGIWSGGSNINSYGVSGMEIKNSKDTLTAYKSWFMFNNEIVCLGSSINNTDNNIIETIIENKKINKDGSNEFIINGIKQPLALGKTINIKNSNWAYLYGNTPDSNIGYYFHQNQDINFIKELKSGSWKDISINNSDTSIKENCYLTMYINHGLNPKDANYSYILFLNKEVKHISNYAKKPYVTIIKNEKFIHGVRNNFLKVEAANFWSNNIGTSGIITADGEASVILQENNNGTTSVGVSDPTFNRDIINITINKKATTLVKLDPSISNVKLGNTISFQVNTKNSLGKTFKIVFK